MHRTTRIKITELNPHVICVLCGGYYINATTITECLHSFCRTCITRYLETSKYCPICDVMVHKTRPLDYIRSDKTLQDLVYKLVPGLYKNEMKRRRDYYSQHPGAETLPPSEDRGVEFHDRIIYTEDEKISLSLELCAEGIPFKTPSQIHGHNGPDNIKINDARYLVCPAAFSVGNLKKFIRMKFDLKPKYEIDIFQTAEPLADFYTLMDIAYIYTWTRRAPLRLYYTVYERMAAPKVPPKVCDKQASTVRDETTPSSTLRQGDSEEVHGVKRKHEEGPDDVSFDLSAVTPEKTEESASKHTKETNKIETCTPKKKTKKHIDSTVLEAVSKSEEILAKLSLNSSNDGGGLMRSEKQRQEALCVNDVDNKVQDGASSKGESLSASTPVKTTTLSKDDSPILSLFEPLNAEPSGNNVYDFNSQEPSSSGVNDKPKAKRGRKKKVVTERDKSEGENSVSNKASGNDMHLVISNKHPGIKAATPKKERKKKVTVSDHTEAKEGKVKAKKIKTGIVHEKAKAKTVKEILENAQRRTIEEKVPRKRGRPQGSSNKVKKVKADDKNKIQQNKPETDLKSQESATQSVDDVQSAVSLKPVSVNGENEVNDNVKSGVGTADNTSLDTSHRETVPKIYTNIEHPVTPPYGQTPKPAELNPGLPVSVTNESVNVVHNGALNSGIFVPSMNGIGAMNGHDFRPVVNGYIPPLDNSDQPLDLTNNAHRNDYTKGKIFKTKMLKKTPTKSDGFTGSGDRAGTTSD